METAPLQDESISFDDIMDEIGTMFDGDLGSEDEPLPNNFERELKSWLQWFTDNYPDRSPMTVLEDTMEQADFRVFFLTYPRSGFSLVRVLEACYYIDKAIYGTSTSKPKTLQNMDRFEYLRSEELIMGWETALCQLEDEIEHKDLGLLLVTRRVQAVANGARALEMEAKNLNERCWEIIRDHKNDGDPIPGNLDGVEDNIWRRATLLNTAAEILQKSLQNFELRKTQSYYRVEDNVNDGQSDNFSKTLPT
jgi:hypothetical protein